MSLGFNAKWVGSDGDPITGYVPESGPQLVYVGGANQAVLSGDGYVRGGASAVDDIYKVPLTSDGNLMDVTFTLLCRTDLPQDMTVTLCYDAAAGSGVTAGLRWGSHAQWSLGANGPSLPFFGYAAFVDVNPTPGKSYLCRLRVRPEDSTFWVDGVVVARHSGTDALGTIAQPVVGIALGGSATLGHSTGWHMGEVRLTTANPRPTSRAVPSGLLAALQGEVLTLAYLVKITREDGTSLGFTTHDVDVSYGGLTYEALAAVQLSNIRQELGGQADNTEVVGITSEQILDSDMRAGLYDNAQLRIMVCDWSDISLGVLTLMRGNIGDITLVDGSYSAGVRSLMQRFQQQIAELTSPTCRVYHLGDARCKFDVTGNTAGGQPAQSASTVATVDDQTTFEMSGIVTDPGFYSQGLLTATSGANSGYRREVKLHSSSDTLSELAIVPTGVPTGNLSFKGIYNYAASATANFLIPPGTWEQASIQITSVWALRNSLILGADQLTTQIPPGQQYDVVQRSAGGNGTYQDTLDLGDLTISLINTLAASSGTLHMALRHTSPQGTNYMNVNVTAAVLTLIGSGGTPSSRLILHEPFPFDVVAGDAFIAQVGCNRSPGRCNSVFNNIVNFRGEPTVPGVDRLMQRGRPPQ